jgi:hypothetical protein
MQVLRFRVWGLQDVVVVADFVVGLPASRTSRALHPCLGFRVQGSGFRFQGFRISGFLN